MSSTIKNITYSPITREMEIEFHHGGRYRYKDVPADAYDAFLNAESQGKHFHAHVKPKYSCEKVEAKK